MDNVVGVCIGIICDQAHPVEAQVSHGACFIVTCYSETPAPPLQQLNMYYKQNFLVVKLLECLPASQTAPSAAPRLANMLKLRIILCYVGDVKKLFELVQEIND